MGLPPESSTSNYWKETIALRYVASWFSTTANHWRFFKRNIATQRTLPIHTFDGSVGLLPDVYCSAILVYCCAHHWQSLQPMLEIWKIYNGEKLAQKRAETSKTAQHTSDRSRPRGKRRTPHKFLTGLVASVTLILPCSLDAYVVQQLQKKEDDYRLEHPSWFDQPEVPESSSRADKRPERAERPNSNSALVRRAWWKWSAVRCALTGFNRKFKIIWIRFPICKLGWLLACLKPKRPSAAVRAEKLCSCRMNSPWKNGLSMSMGYLPWTL